MRADAAGTPGNADRWTASGISNSKVRRRGLAARAIRSARRGSGRPSFRRCATRRGRGDIGAAFKSRQAGAGKSIVLVMEGVFHESVILVDEVAVAVHGDGWTPIEVDLTDALDGKTSFALGVDARVPDDRNGGRIQPVAGRKAGLVRGPGRNLEAGATRGARSGSPRANLRFDAPTTSREGRVVVKGMLSQAAKAVVRLTLSRSGQAVAQHDVPLRSAEFEARLEVANPDPWSPDSAQALRSRGRTRP